jgi:hypothetical protein
MKSFLLFSCRVILGSHKLGAKRVMKGANHNCQNHSTDTGNAHAKGLVLRGRTIDVFTP